MMSYDELAHDELAHELWPSERASERAETAAERMAPWGGRGLSQPAEVWARPVRGFGASERGTCICAINSPTRRADAAGAIGRQSKPTRGQRRREGSHEGRGGGG
eukprot:4945684-Prymnesium_polylepis.1